MSLIAAEFMTARSLQCKRRLHKPTVSSIEGHDLAAVNELIRWHTAGALLGDRTRGRAGHSKSAKVGGQVAEAIAPAGWVVA